MKLVTFTWRNKTSIGAVRDDTVIDLRQAAPQLPETMRRFLEAGGEALEIARRVVESARDAIPLSDVRLEAPVPDPRKFLGIGGNTRSHLEEVRAAGVPIRHSPHQTWFNKQVTCINGPYDDVHLPRISHELDYEGELAMVIGRRCRNVKQARALEVVAGYTVCNDISVRDWQLRAPTATLGKSFDTHGPVGPWIVTADEIPDPHALSLRTWVNDELRMDGRTDEFLHSCDEMIAELSSVFTLEPGDILTTGSPAGVGALMQPPRFLRVGDVVRVEVERIGWIENPIIEAPADFVYLPPRGMGA
ncbi:MAG: fumarylacetoacetate hydrolase family protein [Gammaproteobacteria bacterium]|nr:fumarylacetoacetate hydrolase family protein [Gammaproteobacteria bacterium]